MAVDFRKILIAYIRHIRSVEGTTFIHSVFGPPEGLTDAELEALYNAAADDDAFHEPAEGELADVITDVNPDETPLMAMLRKRP